MWSKKSWMNPQLRIATAIGIAFRRTNTISHRWITIESKIPANNRKHCVVVVVFFLFLFRFGKIYDNVKEDSGEFSIRYVVMVDGCTFDLLHRNASIHSVLFCLFVGLFLCYSHQFSAQSTLNSLIYESHCCYANQNTEYRIQAKRCSFYATV